MFSTILKLNLICAIVLISTLGCKSSIVPRQGLIKPPSSHLTQLTLEQYECQNFPDTRIQQVKNILSSGILVGFTSSDLESAALQALAGIPDEYLEKLKWAHETNNFTINAESPGFSGGLTGLGNPPTWIQISPEVYVISYALKHETGHAMHMMVSTGDFDSELAKVADNNSQNKNLSQYAQSYVGQGETYYFEFFAEAFDSYYCSAGTNAEIKRDFPDVHAFLSKYLAKPIFDDSRSSTTPDQSQDTGVKGIFAALDPSQVIWAATNSQTIKEMAICMGDGSTCKASLQKDIQLKLFETKNNRMFFKGTKISNLEDGTTITILGFDGQNLVESRSVTINSN